MKIIEEYNEPQTDLIEIKSAVYACDFTILIIFNNGVNKESDETFGEAICDHFVDINKMIGLGKGGKRKFDDSILVDFKSFLESSLHPSIIKYLDEVKFKEFSVIDGNLNWNDYDLIFPIHDLYQGKI